MITMILITIFLLENGFVDDEVSTNNEYDHGSHMQFPTYPFMFPYPQLMAGITDRNNKRSGKQTKAYNNPFTMMAPPPFYHPAAWNSMMAYPGPATTSGAINISVNEPRSEEGKSRKRRVNKAEKKEKRKKRKRDMLAVFKTMAEKMMESWASSDDDDDDDEDE